MKNKKNHRETIRDAHMSNTFYIASQGQQLGPFSLEEISLQLNDQKINWHDYIFDQQIHDWVLLMEYPPLTKQFNKSFVTPLKPVPPKEDDLLKSRIWFVLKQNNNYGPFSKGEIIQMLQGKTLHEFDFIWHNEMPSWKRLSEVEEFSVTEIKQIYENMTKEKNTNKDQVFYRRKYPRAKLTTNAIVHDKKKVYKSVSIEISEGGAGLMIESADFKKDQQIYLHFKPATDVPAFNAICKIVSIKGNVYGVQFLKVSAVVKTSIQQYAYRKQAA